MATETRRKQLDAHFATKPSTLRPIVTSLNGDNSWLWSFPRPGTERQSTGKAYYHIVFEPWLNGPTSMLSSWFIHLQLASAPAATNAEDVDAIVQQIETAVTGKSITQQDEPLVDAILIGFHYLDHLHEPTLRLFDKRIPVIASAEAVPKLKQFKHFESVSLISEFTAAETRPWNDPVFHPSGFPNWLTALRMPGHHELNYCLALTWSHPDANNNTTTIHETIIQSPHGIRLEKGALHTFLSAEPPTSKLALFHGLKESHAAGSQNTYGATAGLALYRALGGTKYWLVSHDSLLRYSGLMMRLLWVYDTPRTLEWALGNEGKVEEGDKVPDPRLVDVKNGGLCVLE